MIRRIARRIGGQAAVEAMYCLPIMLLVYLVGAQLWQMTWNAQYAHIKARRDMHDQLKHMPCYGSGQNGTVSATTTARTANAQTNPQPYYGDRFMRDSGRRTMKAKATVICGPTS